MSHAWNLSSNVLVPSPYHEKHSYMGCISRQTQQGAHFTAGVQLNWREKWKKQTQSRQIPTYTETIMKRSEGYCQIFARRPKILKTKKWRIPVKNRVCHRRWHMIENHVTRYHICHFSAISLKNPGDFLLEINQQIFSTHPTLQSKSYTPYLAASSQRRGAGFISVITCKYVCSLPEGNCTSLGLVVEWLETWLCLMMIHDDLCPPEVLGL